MAPSSLVSANTRLSAPVCRVVDHVLGEVLTGLHRGQVRTELRGLRTQVRERAVELFDRGVDFGVGLEARTGDRRQAKAGGVEGDTGDGLRAGAGLVEHHLQVVAVEKVHAVIGRVLRERVDLRQDVVVVRLQRSAGRVRGRRICRALGGADDRADAESGGETGRGGRDRERVLARRRGDVQSERRVRSRTGDTRQRADRRIQLGKRRHLTATVAERDLLVGAAIDRDGQGGAGRADGVEQAGRVVVGAFGQAKRRRGQVGGRGIDREVDIGGDRVELQLAGTVIRSLDQVRTARADDRVDGVDDRGDVFRAGQRDRVVGTARRDDEVTGVRSAERCTETGAGHGAERFVNRVGRHGNRRIAGGAGLRSLTGLLGDRTWRIQPAWSATRCPDRRLSASAGPDRSSRAASSDRWRDC